MITLTKIFEIISLLYMERDEMANDKYFNELDSEDIESDADYYSDIQGI